MTRGSLLHSASFLLYHLFYTFLHEKVSMLHLSELDRCHSLEFKQTTRQTRSPSSFSLTLSLALFFPL